MMRTCPVCGYKDDDDPNKGHIPGLMNKIINGHIFVTACECPACGTTWNENYNALTNDKTTYYYAIEAPEWKSDDRPALTLTSKGKAACIDNLTD